MPVRYQSYLIVDVRDNTIVNIHAMALLVIWNTLNEKDFGRRNDTDVKLLANYIPGV